MELFILIVLILNTLLLICALVFTFMIIEDISSFVSFIRNEQVDTKAHISEEIRKLSKEIVIKNYLKIP